MKNNIIKPLIAIGAIIGTALLTGCENESMQALYGPPASADIIVESYNKKYDSYLIKGKITGENLRSMIDQIESDNNYFAEHTEPTAEGYVEHPTIVYEGQSKDEIEDNANYAVYVAEKNADGFISKIVAVKG